MQRLRTADLKHVLLIDDEHQVRQSYGDSIEELSLKPIEEPGPLGELSKYLARAGKIADAAICDYQLKASGYAEFDGAELVAKLYKQHMPSLLCTRFDRARLDEIRKYLPWVPVIIRPTELNPESLLSGFDMCLSEFHGRFSQERKAWRQLVRIEEVGETHLYVIVPAWRRDEAIRLLISDLPESISASLRPGLRLHALVNLGAASYDRLYFDAWEPD